MRGCQLSEFTKMPKEALGADLEQINEEWHLQLNFNLILKLVLKGAGNYVGFSMSPQAKD